MDIDNENDNNYVKKPFKERIKKRLNKNKYIKRKYIYPKDGYEDKKSIKIVKVKKKDG